MERKATGYWIEKCPSVPINLCKLCLSCLGLDHKAKNCPNKKNNCKQIIFLHWIYVNHLYAQILELGSLGITESFLFNSSTFPILIITKNQGQADIRDFTVITFFLLNSPELVFSNSSA